MTDLGKEFKEIRKRSERSLRQIEAACGVSASTISRFENGHEEISYAFVKAMFDALGYDVTFAVARKEEHSGKEHSLADARPPVGQFVVVMYPDGVWRRASYFRGGLNGIIVCRGIETEIAEFPNMLWKPWRPYDKRDN